MWGFLDSNFFQTLIILIVGLFAFISYKLVKKDEIRKAANLILMEIRDIEKEIEGMKIVTDFFTSSPVITTNSWDKNKHLLANFFDEDEFRLINDFYKTAYRIEEQRNLVREQICSTFIEKSKVMQQKAGDIAINEKDTDEFDKKVRIVYSLISRHTPGLEGDRPKMLIKQLTSDSKMVTTTTAGIKLKNIAKSKKFFII